VLTSVWMQVLRGGPVGEAGPLVRDDPRHHGGERNTCGGGGARGEAMAARQAVRRYARLLPGLYSLYADQVTWCASLAATYDVERLPAACLALMPSVPLTGACVAGTGVQHQNSGAGEDFLANPSSAAAMDAAHILLTPSTSV
jgi:hypothetical protein